METIAHRELRNDSSAILARVAAGESIAVTNHGEVAALLVPPATSELQRLAVSGGIRPPRNSPPGFSRIRRVAGAFSSAEVLNDVRGGR